MTSELSRSSIKHIVTGWENRDMGIQNDELIIVQLFLLCVSRYCTDVKTL